MDHSFPWRDSMGAITFLRTGEGEGWEDASPMPREGAGGSLGTMGALWLSWVSNLFSSMRMRRACWLVMTESASRLK